MYSVFLSYSTKDLEEAEKIKLELSSIGVDVFLAEHDLRAGNNIPQDIIEKIQGANLFLLLWSQNALDSTWCSMEAAAARGAGTRIVPLFLDYEVALPNFVSPEDKYIRLDQNYDKGMRELIKEVYRDSHEQREELATPENVVSFRGANPSPSVQQSVVGDGNTVAGRDVTITNKYSKASKKAPVLPGSVATDLHKKNYLQYLVDKYNEFKRKDVGDNMNYAILHSKYKKKFGSKVADTSLEKFDSAVTWLKGQIDRTIWGKTRKSRGEKNYSSFEEFREKGK